MHNTAFLETIYITPVFMTLLKELSSFIKSGILASLVEPEESHSLPALWARPLPMCTPPAEQSTYWQVMHGRVVLDIHIEVLLL
jgi:hypothetical protein